MSRIRIAIIVGVLAALGAAAYLLLGRSKDKAAAKVDAGVARVDPKPAVTADRAPRLAADDAMVWRDDDPKGPLRIEGQVIDAQDHGVKGAVVSIDTNPPRELTVEDDGSFEITGLIARDYRLEARAGDAHAGPVQLRLGLDSQPVTLRLAAAGTVQVVVRDAIVGMPISGANVELRGGLVYTATTGANGVAELRGVGAGWAPLRVEAKGYAPAAMMLATTGDPAEVQRQVVTLSLGAGVAGRVVDEAGKPVAGARVLAISASEPFPVVDPRRDAAVTGADGKFTLEALAAGTYRFAASHPDFSPATTPPIAIDGHTPREDIEVRLDRGATIRGTVRSPDGQPVAAAAIRVVGKGSVFWRMTRQTFSDENGAFVVRGLPKRAVDVVAWHPSGSSDLAPVDLAATPDAEVTLTLSQLGAIAGKVVDAAGQEIGDAQLVAEPLWTGAMGESDAWVARGVQATIADSGGAFRFAGLPEGAYEIHAARPDASEAALWLSAPTPAKTGDLAVKIVLAADGVVVGKVALPDGKPPAAFTVSIGAARPVPFSTMDGSFEVSAPGGRHALEIAGATFVSKSVPVDVVADDEVDVGTITVAAGRSISGRVLDSSGGPVAGAEVAAGLLISGSGTELNIPEEGFDVQETTTDDDGRFTLAGFSPAPVTLVAGKDGVGRSSSLTVPRSPASVTVELVLEATGSLEGKVTRESAAVPDVPIIASPIGATKSNFFTVTGDDGSFALDTLTGGRYIVYPMLGGGGSRPKDMYIRVIEVNAGARTRADIDATGGTGKLTVTAKTDKGGAVTNAGVVAISVDVGSPATGEALRDATWLADQLETGATVVMHMRQIRGAPAQFEGMRAGTYSVCLTAYPESGVDPNSAEESPMKCTRVEIPGKDTLEMVVPAAWIEPR